MCESTTGIKTLVLRFHLEIAISSVSQVNVANISNNLHINHMTMGKKKVGRQGAGSPSYPQ